ncbi:MAG TPA: DUF4185 domain-containing protein [Pirellulales bacterium]
MPPQPRDVSSRPDRSGRRLAASLLAAGAGWLAAACLAQAAPADAPLRVLEAAPLESLSRAFRQTSGWTGADGAYSIPISPQRTLWTFDDTFIGRIEQGRRAGARMINDSFAWQTLPAGGQPLRFFWRSDAGQPASVLHADDAASWYWPGDGAIVGQRLYLLAKRVRKQAAGEPGFQFDWYGNDLLAIDNPTAEPTQWRWRRIELPWGQDFPQLSSACLVEGGFFYIYGLFPASQLGPLHKPLAVARISQTELAAERPRGWQFWTADDAGGRWSEKPTRLAALFNDAAPEMTIGRVPRIEGLVATYTAIGMSAEIRLRVARRPEGPWSTHALAYRCPEAAQKLHVYGAKAHPELASTPGDLVITYCVNTGSLGEHFEHPDIYVPRAIRIKITAR